MTKYETHIRLGVFLAGEIFCLISLVRFLITGPVDCVLMSAATMLLLCAPYAFERLLHCKISLPVYVFFLLYIISSQLGHSYHFFHIFSWWDNLLHFCGGVAFGLIGFYLPQLLGIRCKNERLACAVFAVCLSMALSLLWEFCEYGSDMLLGTDAQQDTVISAISSYHLGDGIGEVGHMDGIDEVIINGTPLVVGGYLDIGLIDTMTDTLIETLGTAAVVIVLYFDNLRHPALTRKKETIAESSTAG